MNGGVNMNDQRSFGPTARQSARCERQNRASVRHCPQAPVPNHSKTEKKGLINLSYTAKYIRNQVDRVKDPSESVSSARVFHSVTLRSPKGRMGWSQASVGTAAQTPEPSGERSDRFFMST